MGETHLFFIGLMYKLEENRREKILQFNTGYVREYSSVIHKYLKSGEKNSILASSVEGPV